MSRLTTRVGARVRGITRHAHAMLDDRGHPLPDSNQFQRIAVLRNRGEAFVQWYSQLRWFACFLVAAIIGWELTHGRNPLMVAPMGFIFIAGEILKALSLPAGFRNRVASASMARAGTCGTCGFGLTDLGVEADGCVACPECGSAWHQDRWRTRHPNAVALALRAVESSFSGARATQAVDDRGALLTTPMDARAAWLADLLRLPTRTLSSLDALLVRNLWRAKERVLQRFAAHGFPAAALVTATSWFVIGDPETRLFGTIFIGVAAFAMVILAMLAVAPNYIDVRQLAITHLRCPYCGVPLDLNQRRQFDGCIQCATCTAAWILESQTTAAIAPIQTPTTISAAISAEDSDRG